MLLVLVHLRCVGAIFTGGRHHPHARSCAGLGHHCALAATVPNDPAFIDGAREALFEAVASACVVVSGRCEGCASCISSCYDSTGLGNTHQGRRAAHERSTRPVPTKSRHYFIHTLYSVCSAGGCSKPFTEMQFLKHPHYQRLLYGCTATATEWKFQDFVRNSA